MKYEVVAEAYPDVEQATGRLMLIDRIAYLLALTPQELLPTVCYMCQGLVAPEFAAVDLGMAEKLALRAVATATGVEPGDVIAAVREAGDLGQAAEQLSAATAGDRTRRTASPVHRPRGLHHQQAGVREAEGPVGRRAAASR